MRSPVTHNSPISISSLLPFHSHCVRLTSHPVPQSSDNQEPSQRCQCRRSALPYPSPTNRLSPCNRYTSPLFEVPRSLPTPSLRATAIAKQCRAIGAGTTLVHSHYSRPTLPQPHQCIILHARSAINSTYPNRLYRVHHLNRLSRLSRSSSSNRGLRGHGSKTIVEYGNTGMLEYWGLGILEASGWRSPVGRRQTGQRSNEVTKGGRLNGAAWESASA